MYKDQEQLDSSNGCNSSTYSPSVRLPPPLPNFPRFLTASRTAVVKIKFENMLGNRGVVGDKWSQRVLWLCAIGSAIGLYMVAVERQTQNRNNNIKGGLLNNASSGPGEEI